MEQPMFSVASYHGERKLAWKRICNTFPDRFPGRPRPAKVKLDTYNATASPM